LQKSVARAKNANVFAKFFGEYIFKIRTSVPGLEYATSRSGPESCQPTPWISFKRKKILLKFAEFAPGGDGGFRERPTF
jgi:hypothetical protein